MCGLRTNKPSSNFLTDRSKTVLLLWIFFVICVCLCHTVMSVSCSLVVTCWERADLLTLLYVFLCFCHFPIWVSCDTWLYRFLIVAFFLTYYNFFHFIFRFDYDRKLLESAIQNDIQMKEIMKTFNSALQEIKGKYNKFRSFREGFIFAKVSRTLNPCE